MNHGTNVEKGFVANTLATMSHSRLMGSKYDFYFCFAIQS
jgi:hypothetical protein